MHTWGVSCIYMCFKYYLWHGIDLLKKTESNNFGVYAMLWWWLFLFSILVFFNVLCVYRASVLAPGSIRASYTSTETQNAVHGADSEERVKREIKWFFPDFCFEEWERTQDLYRTSAVYNESLGVHEIISQQVWWSIFVVIHHIMFLMQLMQIWSETRRCTIASPKQLCL